MTTELFANDYVTSLAQACAATDTTLYLKDPLPLDLQGAGEFRLELTTTAGAREYVLAQAGGSPTTVIVVRGAEGSTAVAFPVGALVAQVLTVAGVENALSGAETTAEAAAQAATSTAVGSETTRAETAEGANASAISSETTRAQAAEAGKASASALSAETARAEAAEAAGAVSKAGVIATGVQATDLGGDAAGAASAAVATEQTRALGVEAAKGPKGVVATPEQYGAKGDAVIFTDGAMVAGSTTLTTSSITAQVAASLNAAATGGNPKHVYVRGALGSPASYGATSAALSTGGAITSIPRTAGSAVPEGWVWVISGAHAQAFVVSNPSAANGPITVYSQTPTYAFPVGSTVIAMGATPLLGTITSATTGSATLSVSAGNTVQNTCGWYATDDGAAFAAAAAACAAAGGGVVLCDAKAYGLANAPQAVAITEAFGTAYTYAQIPILPAGVPGTDGIISFQGAKQGSEILSFRNDGYSTTYGAPAVIGGGTFPYPSDLGYFPLSMGVDFKDLTISVPENAAFAGIDASLCAGMTAENLAVQTAALLSGGPYGMEGIVPTNPCAFGIRWPYADNNGSVRGKNVNVNTFYCLHVCSSNLIVDGNTFGAVVGISFQDPNGGRGASSVFIPYMTMQSCKYLMGGWDPVNGAKSFAAGGVVFINDAQLFVEDGFFMWGPASPYILDANSTICGKIVTNHLTGLGYSALNIPGGTGLDSQANDPTVPNDRYQTFTSSGTWTKPGGIKWVKVDAIGSGCGGTSGSVAATSTAALGGAGGGGGGYSSVIFPASVVPASVAVTVGAGGSGGAAVTSGAGNAPKYGFPSQFGSLVSASGGTGTTAEGGGTIQSGPVGGQPNGTGAAPAGLANTWVMTAAGGAGAGITAANAASTGAGGGQGSGGVTSQAGAGANGADTAALTAALGGGAGGGGSSSLTANGGAGGAGGRYGAGGGGGGAARTGFASGAGGNGGAGVVVVTCW